MLYAGEPYPEPGRICYNTSALSEAKLIKIWNDSFELNHKNRFDQKTMNKF